MTFEKLGEAIAAAYAFIEAAEVAQRQLADPGSTYGITGSKETATARRRSMDLTRALAEMRRPG